MIGFISSDRLENIPAAYRAKHEFCFFLHDVMTRNLVQMESQKAGHIKIDIETEEEMDLLKIGTHILDFLSFTGRKELERRVVVNHICIALYSDILHFIYEGLRALEKRKFSVAFSLLRKPFKEGMLVAAQMCADEVAFFDTLKSNAKNLLNRRELNEESTKKILQSAIDSCGIPTFVTADSLYETIFDRGNEYGMAGLFDKATHLFTDYSKIRTENYNINFIFKDPADNDIYRGEVYSQIARALLFLNIAQIELYDRMKTSSKKYKSWVYLTSIGAYEAIFKAGRGHFSKFFDQSLSEFLNCAVCSSRIRIKKSNAARLLIAETIECEHCETTQHFPFSWLLSKVDLDFSK